MKNIIRFCIILESEWIIKGYGATTGFETYVLEYCTVQRWFSESVGIDASLDQQEFG